MSPGATQLFERYWRVEVPNDRIPGVTSNAYIVGGARVIVVDPGSAGGHEPVLDALDRLGGPKVEAIVLTHGHHDHAASAAPLQAATGAPVWLDPVELREIEYRNDDSVPLDVELSDGATLQVEDLVFDFVHTPGHSVGHYVLVERGRGITLAGDLVSGHGSVLVPTPFGNLADYLRSLELLMEWPVTTVLPGHGPVLEDGKGALQQHCKRRLSREAEVLALLAEGLSTIPELAARLYPDVVPHYRTAAAGMLLIHLEKLHDEGCVRQVGTGDEARYTLVGEPKRAR